MANITAPMVKELRESTGAGMMDCKSALTETNGDMPAAQDWLRKKGLSKAAKKAGRVAAEGLIGVLVKGIKGVVVEVNSETDFVARNDLFQGLVKMIADVALTAGTDVEKIKAAKAGSDHGGRSHLRHDRQDRREHDVAPRRVAQSVAQGAIGSYVHNSVVDGLGKIGVMVALESTGKADELVDARPHGRHACRLPPIRRRSIPPASIRPWSSARRTCSPTSSRQQGKPANVIEKIVESGLKTFYKEVCLLEQAYMHDDKKTVAQALKEAEGKVGGPSRSPASCVTRSARASRGRKVISPPRSRLPPVKADTACCQPASIRWRVEDG